MRLNPQSMRLTDDGILVEGPLGPVLLTKSNDKLSASYRGKQSSQIKSYTQNVIKQAIAIANNYPLGWTYDADGTLRITDQELFYTQTFSPEALCLETLNRWLQPIQTE